MYIMKIFFIYGTYLLGEYLSRYVLIIDAFSNQTHHYR